MFLSGIIWCSSSTGEGEGEGEEEGEGRGGGMSVVMFAHCPVRTDNRMYNGRELALYMRLRMS